MATKKTVAVKSKAKPKGSIYERLAGSIQKSSGGKKFWKVPDGVSTIRLVPFEHDGVEELAVMDCRHWNIEVDGEEATFLLCGGDDCPLCDLRDEVSASTWGKIRGNKKFLVNAVVRKSPLHDEKDALVVAQLPPSVYNEILERISGDGADVPDALCPNKGRDFKITKTGQGLKTKYKVVPVASPSKIGISVEPVDLMARVKEADQEALSAAAKAISQSD